MFQIRIHWYRIWHFRLNGEYHQYFGFRFIGSGSGSSILDWKLIHIQGFDDQKLGKITAKKNFIFFWSKIAIYLSLGLHIGRPSHRRSLQPSKENIQHFKTWNFFFILRVIFTPLDPGPDPKSGSRSTDLIESGSGSETQQIGIQHPI